MFFNYTYAQLDRAYERAPREVKHLITMLQNPEFMKRPQLRVRMFQGEPGTEKSTSAYMVCYMLRNLFKCCPINCGDFSGKGRGTVPELFRKKVEEALASVEEDGSGRRDSRGVIILLEEIQEVLDYADDPHYDTATNARFLAGCLDRLKFNHKAFFIPTSNGDENFSNQIKGRLKGHTIFFKAIESSDERLAALHEHLRLRGIILDDSCDDAFLIDQMQKLDEWVGRDFELLVTPLIEAFLDDCGDLSRIVINKDQVLRGIKKMQAAVDHTKKGKPETPEDRRLKKSIRVQIKMASRQQSQRTESSSESMSLGAGGIGISGSDTVSRTSAGGLERRVASDIYREEYDEELEDSGAGAAVPTVQGPLNGELVINEGFGKFTSYFADSETGEIKYADGKRKDGLYLLSNTWIIDGKEYIYNKKTSSWEPLTKQHDEYTCAII